MTDKKAIWNYVVFLFDGIKTYSFIGILNIVLRKDDRLLVFNSSENIILSVFIFGLCLYLLYPYYFKRDNKA